MLGFRPAHRQPHMSVATKFTTLLILIWNRLSLFSRALPNDLGIGSFASILSKFTQFHPA